MSISTPVKAILFDLDGTLIDSHQAIAKSANHALAQQQIRPLDNEAWRPRIGYGARALFEGIAPDVNQALQDYSSHHQETGHINSRRFLGISEMLDMLTAEQNIQISILSNKPHDALGKTIPTLLKNWNFTIVQGHEASFEPKPDPTKLLEIIASLGCNPSEVAYAGDSEVDIQVAKNAGCKSIAVSWGLRSAETLLKQHPDYLLRYPTQLLPLAGIAEPNQEPSAARELLSPQEIDAMCKVFYQDIKQDKWLGDMYPEEDLVGAEERLAGFIKFRLGFDDTYVQQRGHPRLRGRHMPFAIGGGARDAWLQRMHHAMHSTTEDNLGREQLWRFFCHLAWFMMNKN